MTDNNRTWIAVLLDRSGSMQAMKSDVEGGFNAFIDEQRKADGECIVTLAQFDTVYEVVYAETPVSEVPALDLQPRGGTALLDSMGALITQTAARLAAMPEDKRPGSVIVAVMTDGRENSSREWTHKAVKELVQQQTDKDNWEFLYMGANQDAIEEGAKLGVSRYNSMTYSADSALSAMRSTSSNISAYRRARAACAPEPSLAYTDEQRREASDSKSDSNR